MSKSFNPNHLQPGDHLNTLAGRAVFLEFKEGNFRNQNYKVRLIATFKTLWYTDDQLRQANRREEVEV